MKITNLFGIRKCGDENHDETKSNDEQIASDLKQIFRRRRYSGGENQQLDLIEETTTAETINTMFQLIKKFISKMSSMKLK